MISEDLFSGSATRVLIVEHHSEIRDLLSQMLASEPDMEVVGATTNTEAAVKLAVELVPDVAIVDLNLPGDGIWLTRHIKELLPATQIIVLADDMEPDRMRQALLAGAKDYFTRELSRSELMASVREAGKWRPPSSSRPQ